MKRRMLGNKRVCDKSGSDKNDHFCHCRFFGSLSNGVEG
uniref:Uncharacterized protein n=1 Tax=Loigolactobacillus rennini TaxID=238013 RepID=A0A1K2IBS6_9LACO|nr:hypothetical protein LREN565_2266 [Loigolactobacillus rennini]